MIDQLSFYNIIIYGIGMLGNLHAPIGFYTLAGSAILPVLYLGYRFKGKSPNTGMQKLFELSAGLGATIGIFSFIIYILSSFIGMTIPTIFMERI